VTAGQLIYGPPPPGQANGTAVDTTVAACTPGFLDQQSINSIQWYLLGGTPPQGAPPRRVYAVIGSHERRFALIGEVRGVPYGGEATERLVAHFLLVDADEFEAQAGANPFYVFDHFHFARTDDEAKAVREALGRPTAVSFEPQPGPGHEAALRWGEEPEALRSLVALALAAHEVTHSSPPRAIALVGSVESCEDTLRALMALLSPKERMEVSFSSGLAGGTLAAPLGWRLWARQSEETATDRRLVNVDTHARSVEGTWDRPMRCGPYGRWLLERLKGTDAVPGVLADRTRALRAERVLLGEAELDRQTWDALSPAIDEIAEQPQALELVERRVVEFARIHIAPHAAGLVEDSRLRAVLKDRGVREQVAMMATPQAFCHHLLLSRLNLGGRMDEVEAREWETVANGLGLSQHGLPGLLLAALELRRARVQYGGDERSPWIADVRARFREMLLIVTDGPQVSRWLYRDCCRGLVSTGLAHPSDLYLPGRAGDLLSVDGVRDGLADDPDELVRLTLSIAPDYLGPARPVTPDAAVLSNPEVLALYEGLPNQHKREIIESCRGLPQSALLALESRSEPGVESSQMRGGLIDQLIGRLREGLPEPLGCAAEVVVRLVLYALLLVLIVAGTVGVLWLMLRVTD